MAVFTKKTKKCFFHFFYIWVFFYEHSRITGLQGKGHFFNSSLQLPPASQTPRHQPGDYCRELTSAHSQQPDMNREPLVSERKSLTIKLRTLKFANTFPVKTLYQSNTSNSYKTIRSSWRTLPSSLVLSVISKSYIQINSKK